MSIGRVRRVQSVYDAMAEVNADAVRVEVGELIHCGPHVVVEVRLTYFDGSAASPVVHDQLHWWTLGEDDEVRRFRRYDR